MGPVDVLVGGGVDVTKVEVGVIGMCRCFCCESIGCVVTLDAGVALDFVESCGCTSGGPFFEAGANSLNEVFVAVKHMCSGVEHMFMNLEETTEAVTKDGDGFCGGNDISKSTKNPG